jgi:hypothetical protein
MRLVIEITVFLSTLWTVGERREKKNWKQNNFVCFLALRFCGITFAIDDLRCGDRCIADDNGDVALF